MRNSVIIVFFAVLLTVFTFAGCDGLWDSTPDEPRYDATKILKITVEPNPVVQGDTATFTCVIKDSLEDGFSYSWSFPNYQDRFETDHNTLSWPVTFGVGKTTLLVRVSKKSTEINVYKFKEFTIIGSN